MILGIFISHPHTHDKFLYSENLTNVLLIFVGVKDEAAFNVALVELAGHIPIKSEYGFKIGFKIYHNYLGFVATKPVFGVSDKACLKPVSKDTETS